MVLGKSTSATTPSASSSASRRSSSQFRFRVPPVRSLNGLRVAVAPRIELVEVLGFEIGAVLLVIAAGVAVRRNQDESIVRGWLAHEGTPPPSPRCSRCRRRRAHGSTAAPGPVPSPDPRSAVRRPGTRCGTLRKAGWRVTLPVQTMRVSMPWRSMCSWNSDRRTPDSGRISTGNMCQAVSSSGVVRGRTKTSGRWSRSAHAVERSFACARRGCRRASPAAPGRRRPRAPTARSSSPTSSKMNRLSYSRSVVDGREEPAALPLLRSRRAGPQSADPSDAAAGSGRSGRRRRDRPCHRSRRR